MQQDRPRDGNDRSVVGEFVGFDSGHDGRVFRMVVEDVVDNLVVVLEPKVAVGAGVRFVGGHGSIYSRPPDFG